MQYSMFSPMYIYKIKKSFNYLQNYHCILINDSKFLNQIL
jgi:hypothetical protein